MPLDFKAKTGNREGQAGGWTKLMHIASVCSLMVSLVGLCLIFRLFGALYPTKPVQVECPSELLERLNQSAERLEKMMPKTIQYNGKK